jgi:hypothetical protein
MVELGWNSGRPETAMPRVWESNDSNQSSCIVNGGWGCVDCGHPTSHYEDCWSKPLDLRGF